MGQKKRRLRQKEEDLATGEGEKKVTLAHISPS